MRGLLADVNVQGHLPYLRWLLGSLGLWSLLAELPIDLVTFQDLQLSSNLDDRSIWNRCQQEGWVLFTENRNRADPDSLEATLMDSWRIGHLPVLTLSDKGKFEHKRAYAQQVASDVADLLFDIADGKHCDQPRIYVPRRWPVSRGNE